MTFTNCLIAAGIVAGLIAVVLIVRELCHSRYSRRMTERAMKFRPHIYTQTKARGCSIGR